MSKGVMNERIGAIFIKTVGFFLIACAAFRILPFSFCIMFGI